MEITAEMILKSYPAVWWQIWRQGRDETMNDPNMQREMAQRHLEATLTKRGATTPAQPSPQAPAVTISAEQAKVNAALGLSTEEFVEHNRAVPSQLDPVQREVNEQLGLKEEDFLKYSRA
jgi:hypothetical protein